MSALIYKFVPFTIFTASILGSPHCAAMCGGLVLALAPTRKQKFLYHLGRLFGYASLGAAAGFLGRTLLDSNSNRITAWLATGVMAITLTYLGLSLLKGMTPHFKPPAFLRRITNQVWQLLIQHRNKNIGTLGLGFISSFLPCGWLYSFVLAATTTSSVLWGALSLIIFWAGTLPALSFAGAIFQKLLLPFQKTTPRISAGLLILAAILTLTIRTSSLAVPTVESQASLNQNSTRDCPLHRAMNRRAMDRTGEKLDVDD